MDRKTSIDMGPLKHELANQRASDKLEEIIEDINSGKITKEKVIELLDSSDLPTLPDAQDIKTSISGSFKNPPGWLITLNALKKGRVLDKQALGNIQAVLGKKPKR